MRIIPQSRCAHLRTLAGLFVFFVRRMSVRKTDLNFFAACAAISAKPQRGGCPVRGEEKGLNSMYNIRFADIIPRPHASS